MYALSKNLDSTLSSFSIRFSPKRKSSRRNFFDSSKNSSSMHSSSFCFSISSKLLIASEDDLYSPHSRSNGDWKKGKLNPLRSPRSFSTNTLECCSLIGRTLKLINTRKFSTRAHKRFFCLFVFWIESLKRRFKSFTRKSRFFRLGLGEC